MKFRPCIDLHQGKVKQIIGSTLSDQAEGGPAVNFASELPPAYYAAMYRRDRLEGGHVIMLGPGNQRAAVEALQAFPGGLQVGGGITADNARYWLEQGASGVIVTSYVFQNGRLLADRLRKLRDRVGAERLILDLSCRKRQHDYYVVTDRWQRFTELAINEKNLASLARYCAEFLIHAVDVEGRCRGIEEELVRLLGRQAPIPTTYAGGVQSLADLERIRELGKDRLDATIGSALDIFGGSGVRYVDAVAFNRRQGH